MSLLKSICLVTLFSLIGLVGAVPSASAQALSDLDRQRTQLMLDVIGKDLVKYYYDSTYGSVPLQALIDSTRAQLGRAQSNEQSFGLIGRVFLALHNSQTYFVPPQHTTAFDYGWELQCIGDSTYITQVDSASDAAAKGIQVGDRVLAINHVAIDRADFIPYQYVLYGLQPRSEVVLTVATGGAPPRDVVAATKLTPGKRLFDVSGFNGVGDRLQFWLKDQAYWAARKIHLTNVTPNILLWHMLSMSVPDDDLYAALDRASHSSTLILDLRNNVGGSWVQMLKLLDAFAPDSDAGVLIGRFAVRDPSTANALVGELVGKEFKDSIYFRPDDHHHFAGQLIVLVDSRTYGKGELIADAVRRFDLGRVI
ncbi:MAG: S41 family peptidase [Gemmatimonadales bacterium]